MIHDPATPGDGVPPPIDRPPEAELLELTFDPTDELLVNPERGFYRSADLFDLNDAENVREDGRTLALSIVDLPPTGALDAAYLDDLRAGFDRVRDSGIKLVLRFRYGRDFDAPRDVILGQLEQLAPILDDYVDVISFMQAGFIGRWGEWHSSTNGLDNPEDRATILHAILDALPAERMVQVRTPMFKAETFPDAPLDGALAYTGDDAARVGHHNDCFLSSDSDLGTYAHPVDEWTSYVAEDSEFTPVGGETCVVNEPRSACEAAVAQMRDHHWSYLNWEYKREVLDRWTEQGCMDEVEQSLGYRFRLTGGFHSEQVAPGGQLYVEFSVANDGFASLYNERPLEVAIERGDTRLVAELDVDPRSWRSGETTTVSAWLQLPADMPAGAYSVAVALPDRNPILAADPRYSIALANLGVWRPAVGDNVISNRLEVTADASGAVDPSATEFAQLAQP